VVAEPDRSAPGLLVDEELARAIRTESAATVGHSWRVSVSWFTRYFPRYPLLGLLK
jgi:hypothetical protein